MMTRGTRLGIGVLGGAVVLTGVIGLLHLPAAVPLRRAVFGAAVCPVMRGSPAQIDRAHALGVASIRATATVPAPSRFALGFRLDETRRSDLDAWAASHGVKCRPIAGNDNLQRCADVPPSELGQPAAPDVRTLEELTFEFRSTGELVNVQTLRRRLSPEQAAFTANRLERAAAESLGSPTTVGGAATAAHLSGGPLYTYVAVHNFSDYRATISATNLPPTGVMVREEYLSVR
jgi:hypothetical protein